MPGIDNFDTRKFERRVRLAAPAALALLIALAWANSLGAPFRFDDRPAIVDNQAIRSLLDWHWSQRGVQGARAYLEGVRDIAPERVGTHLVLGHLERHVQAEAHSRNALALDADNPYALSGLAALTRSP